MIVYRHIFFDLDHTLWDFEKNCAETLDELFVTYRMSTLGFGPEDLIEKYKLVNNRMWYDYNRGRIGKEEIRKTRFELTFQELGIDKSYVPEGINEAFLSICPAKGNVMPFAHEALSYLHGKYKLHIITNGFKDTQYVKISTSKLDRYFSEIVDSENSGASKPDKQIFEYAMNKANALQKESVMIGDDLYTDVLGARNAGMDHVYYNPRQEAHTENVLHEIKCLSELMNLL